MGVQGFAMLEEVRGYWMAKCAGTLPPLRAEIDPRGIAGALEHSLIAERNAAGSVVVRIAGMGLAAMAGVDLSGMPLLTLFDTPARDGVAGVMARVLEEPATAELWLEGLRGPGRPPLEGRLLLLPLRASDGRTRMILGCLVTVGDVGQPPRRFAVARRVVSPMVEQAAEPAFAEPAASFAPRPHLRVVRRAS